MAVGKYSPTVTAAYMNSQTWWQPADENTFYDKDGYDSYGYNKDNIDRADNAEILYMSGQDDGFDGWEYPLYQDTLYQWTFGKDGYPATVESVRIEKQKEADAIKMAKFMKEQHQALHKELKSKVRFVVTENDE